MRVICPFCFNKARIVRRCNLNDAYTVADLYCQCSNVQTCGATFVYALGFKHVLNPPMATHQQMAFDLVNRLSKEEKDQLIESFNLALKNAPIHSTN